MTTTTHQNTQIKYCAAPGLLSILWQDFFSDNFQHYSDSWQIPGWHFEVFQTTENGPDKTVEQWYLDHCWRLKISQLLDAALAMNDVTHLPISSISVLLKFYLSFLRAIAHISYGNSVHLSVRYRYQTRYRSKHRWDRDFQFSSYDSLVSSISWKKFKKFKTLDEGDLANDGEKERHPKKDVILLVLVCLAWKRLQIDIDMRLSYQARATIFAAVSTSMTFNDREQQNKGF